MIAYDSFFNSKGKAEGCVLLAIKPDPHMNTYLYIYYIGSDSHVGVVAQGITATIASINHSLFMFAKGELSELIVRAKNGVKIDIAVPLNVRKKLEVLLEIPPALIRKQLFKTREVTRA